MWVLSQSLNRLPLKRLYFTIIIVLFLGIVGMQVLNVRISHIHHENSRLIELSGRQKVLSQQMVKLALLTERGKDALESIVHQLSRLNEEWSRVHFNLKFGTNHGKTNPPSSKKIEELILRMQPHKDGISDAVNELLMVAHVSELRPEAIHKIITHEGQFLLLMDELAAAYQLEAEENIAFLHSLKLFLMLASLLALLALLLLSYRIRFNEHYAYGSQRIMDKKEFFSETVADEFMLAQASSKQQSAEEEYDTFNVSAKKQILPQNPLTYTRQRIKVLMIADASLPTDYIAWFLNKWEIDFSIVKNKELAQLEAQSQTFDMVLMSQQQALDHEKEYFFVEKDKMTKIPIVTLEASDIKEIHTQIYGKNSTESDSKNVSPGALYKKIREQLSRETWGV